MRPFPLILGQTVGPAFVGRPWWRNLGYVVAPRNLDTDAAMLLCWQRRDGLRYFPTTGRLFRGGERLSFWEQTTDTAIPNIDREWPIPRPPYRAGQVWLTLAGEQVLVLGVYASGEPVLGITPPNGPLDYLLHDPVMPEDAPWSAAA